MAAKEIIRPPFKSDLPGVTDGGYRWFQEASNKINLSANPQMQTYANNGAALAGGLVVGDFYATATGEVRIVV